MAIINDRNGLFLINLTATQNADLHEIDFRNGNLVGLIFDQSQMTGCNLNNASLGTASFKNAILFHVTFRGATIGITNFTGADLRQADFSGVIQTFNCTWTGANIFGSIWDSKSQFDAVLGLGAINVPGPRPLPLNL